MDTVLILKQLSTRLDGDGYEPMQFKANAFRRADVSVNRLVVIILFKAFYS